MSNRIDLIKDEELCFACGVLNVIKEQAEEDKLVNLVGIMAQAQAVLAAELDIRTRRTAHNELTRIFESSTSNP